MAPVSIHHFFGRGEVKEQTLDNLAIFGIKRLFLSVITYTCGNVLPAIHVITSQERLGMDPHFDSVQI